MNIFKTMMAASGLCVAASLPQMAAADAKIYAYPTSENYCPAGFQPVTINGVICCGKPNQSMSYQQMMAHPAPRRTVRRVVHQTRRSARPACIPGTKGCVSG